MDNKSNETIDIFRIFYILWKRKWLILGATVLFSISIILFVKPAKSIPTYSATNLAYSSVVEEHLILPFSHKLVTLVNSRNYPAISELTGIALEECEKIKDIQFVIEKGNPYAPIKGITSCVNITVVSEDVNSFDTIFKGIQYFFQQNALVNNIFEKRTQVMNELSQMIEQEIVALDNIKARYSEDDFKNNIVFSPGDIYTQKIDLKKRKSDLEETLLYFSSFEYFYPPIVYEKPVYKKRLNINIVTAIAIALGVSLMVVYVFEFFIVLRSKFKSFED